MVNSKRVTNTLHTHIMHNILFDFVINQKITLFLQRHEDETKRSQKEV